MAKSTISVKVSVPGIEELKYDLRKITALIDKINSTKLEVVGEICDDNDTE